MELGSPVRGPYQWFTVSHPHIISDPQYHTRGGGGPDGLSQTLTLSLKLESVLVFPTIYCLHLLTQHGLIQYLSLGTDSEFVKNMVRNSLMGNGMHPRQLLCVFGPQHFHRKCELLAYIQTLYSGIYLYLIFFFFSQSPWLFDLVSTRNPRLPSAHQERDVGRSHNHQSSKTFGT